MNYNQGCHKSSWLERIKKYDDLKETEECERLECSRKENEIIRKINEVNTKLDAVLFSVNCLMHSEANKNTPNSKKKAKVDKLAEKKPKGENKGKRIRKNG